MKFNPILLKMVLTGGTMIAPELSLRRRIARRLPAPLKILIKQVRYTVLPKGPGLPRPRNATNEYIVKTPSAENAISLFAGEWSSKLPGFESITGPTDLYDDHRVTWFNELAPFKDKTVLELGPLEAGHTRQMSQLGAKKVTAVEANSRAYLKCLIAKEIYGIERAEFLLGSFDKFLEDTPQDMRWDSIFACGVLYHSQDPLHLLDLISQHTDRVFIWTHFYDRAALKKSPDFSRRFSSETEYEVRGFKTTYYKQHYNANLFSKGFTGGVGRTSYWVTRDAIVGFLKHVGFSRIELGSVAPNHKNGPCFSLAAFR